ncbi:ArdC family protein [Cyanobium gracile]|uniref:ArdC-like ssDNA-binding domain-containing protein n=1 Tax=Cyanobium gracile TaxID=59930 RepID=UPI0006850886
METASSAGRQKPWITTRQNTLQPVNAASRREYRGVNVLMLWVSAEIAGYQDGRWASFRQWQQISTQVRRGEKGTPVVFYEEMPRRGGGGVDGPIRGQFEEAAAEATGSGNYLLAKTNYVFKAAQVEGNTPPERPQPPGVTWTGFSGQGPWLTS